MRKISVECVETVNHHMKSNKFQTLPVSARALFLSLVMFDDNECARKEDEWLSITNMLGYSEYDYLALVKDRYFVHRMDGKLRLSDNNG